MRLIEAQVKNFKCVEDSESFGVDDVTCLVGKNEAGKTALLQALSRLNPINQDKAEFVESDYPRRELATGRERKERETANVLTTQWKLESEDVEALEAVTAAVQGETVTLLKGYDNQRRWEVASLIDERAVVSALVADAKLDATEGNLGKPNTIKQLKDVLEGRNSPTEKHNTLLEKIKTQFPNGFAARVVDVLEERLPVFVYFDFYDKLPGEVSLADLKSRQTAGTLNRSDEIFLALLEMTTTGLEEIENADLEKLIMELEAVEARLTDTIKKYWTQNQHLDVRFRKDIVPRADTPPKNEDCVISTRVFNTRHRASVGFDERSAGFVWFFSFLVWFSQARDHYGENLVLLLDEPGLSLHGKAQQDLIRYINEELRPNYQVLYTTHSPFMIDVEHIFSLRAVEDIVEIEADGQERILGTKVSEKILSRDADTLFPLQGVMGFDVAQTLFVGPYVVVVEGPSEMAFFNWFSRRLAGLGREALDLRWAVCPAEGAGKISGFVTLFAGRGLKIAVLADYHEGQKKMIDKLEESGLLAPNHLLRTSTYAGQAEADIEDVVGREMYVELVNGCLGIQDQHRMPTEKPDDAPERVVKEADAFCALLPPGYSEFNHYLPADYLVGLSPPDVESLPGVSEALGRFETAFKALNSLIGSE